MKKVKSMNVITSIFDSSINNTNLDRMAKQDYKSSCAKVPF